MSLANFFASLVFESAENKDPDTHCMPWLVDPSDRCQYVKDQISVCGEGTGLVPYMRIHYCTFDFSPLLSHVLLFSWIFLLFLMLLVVTEHFFCPALEVISDFFKLPENVAGATLLSFGNGAPDFFTQLAAIATMDSSSVPIAIGEPIGGGLFVSNVVLGAVVFLSGGATGSVPVQRRAFLRDSGFYGGSMVVVGVVLYDEQVNLLEALLMCAYYAVFVAYIAIFDSSRSSPLNIADSHHYQDVLRNTESQPSDTAPALYPIAPSPLGLASCHALPERAEAVQALGANARHSWSLSGGLTPAVDPGHPADDTGVEGDGNEALLVTPRCGDSGETAVSTSAKNGPASPADIISGNPQVQNSHISASGSTGSTSQVSSDPVNAPNPFLSNPQSLETAQNAAKTAIGQATAHERSDTEAHRTNATSGLGGATEDPSLDDVQAPLLPSNIPNSTLFLPPVATSPDASRSFRSAEVGDTGTAVQSPGEGGANPPSRTGLMEFLKHPLICMARLTMPEVGMADHVRYPKVYAVLLPVTAPLFVVLAKKLALAEASPLNSDALLYGFVCSGFSSLIVASIYPSDGKHYGVLSGLFTAIAFSMSVLWMNITSAEMVRSWKVLGYIHGVSQSMLGVTVLAWVNSAGDFIADAAMARDGFPDMAVAACFASPFFTMIGGLGLTFLLAVTLHGTVQFKPGTALNVALGFAAVSVVRHLVLVPLVHGWKLTRSAAVGMFVFYLVFQAAYLYLISLEPVL